MCILIRWWWDMILMEVHGQYLSKLEMYIPLDP